PGVEASPELELKIMNFIRKKLSSIAMPQEIEYMAQLPKTRSGKIMRRLIRSQLMGGTVDDITTLANPEAVDAIGKVL
ncbi:MAG: acetyl-coenzyme A synthetase, partial [Thermoplasmata archaeon]|nr:acetyl-coenzyme A synthetase [Thermoplasmata archaeon]